MNTGIHKEGKFGGDIYMTLSESYIGEGQKHNPGGNYYVASSSFLV